MDLLKKTFQHIEGIGEKKESLLWEEGVIDWEDTLDKINYYAMPKSMRETLKDELPRTIYNYKTKNYNYFLKRFPTPIIYRLYPALMDKTVFLDIETTGIKPSKAHVTVIGCYDGFFGPGTGTFLIIAFSAFAGFDLLTSSGNAKLVNLASNVAAFITFAVNGNILWYIGLPAAVFGIAGNILGSRMALKKGAKFIRPMFIVILVILFIKMFAM